MKRTSGILLHLSSLPCRHGLGDFGPQAREFVDFLAASGQTVWQMLPVTPINAGAGNSPYSSYSAFAGNTLFISPDLLVQEGVLNPQDTATPPPFSPDRADYAQASWWRTRLLNLAFDTALPSLRHNEEFLRFCQAEAYWLPDFALFMALKEERGSEPWYAWPQELRLRDPQALEQARDRLGYAILREEYFQYLFSRHWNGLRAHATRQGISLLGDAPIYVSLDSSDVWSHRELFELDHEGRPIFCAGAPPDYFSATGQMWGNPVYDWERHAADGFDWWIKRLSHEGQRFDMIRLDHFRGFCGFWQVPACEPTAENGVWIPAPGQALFSAVRHAAPDLRIVAEDLGVITPDVVELMKSFNFPGMKVLQFAFSPDMARNPYIPHNVGLASVVYTGTHDNNTTRGWFTQELDQGGRDRVRAYAGWHIPDDMAAEALTRMALASAAELCIIPMQDYLNLGREGRMNIPGVAGGNWSWRMHPDMLTDDLRLKTRRLSEIYGRAR